MSVLIFVENWDGKFKKLTFELVSYGARVAEMTGTEAIALSCGKVDAEELIKLGKYGAGKILNAAAPETGLVDSRYLSSLIKAAVLQEKANVVILSDNNTGKAVAPRISVNLKAGMGAGVNQLPESTDPFVVRKKVFSGNAFARLELKSEIKIITLAQNCYELNETTGCATIAEFLPDIEPGKPNLTVVETQKQTGKVLLTDAEIVVSGGRGMKSGDNWAPILELAELLGAATACSRPVSDEGWRPHEEHTGQTGKIIAPNLYIAIGISGATQHLAGVSSSKYIVAINTDKDAPIFSAAQYGIVGDASKILPKLVAAVREMKAK